MLQFDDSRRQVRDGDTVVEFGRARILYRLLRHIALQPGLERKALYEAAWDLPYRPPSSDNSFHVSLNKLRKKVPWPIELVGSGYHLAGQPAASARPRRKTPWLLDTAALRDGPGTAGPLHALLDEHPVVAVTGPPGTLTTQTALQVDGVLFRCGRLDTVDELDAILAAELDADTAAAGLRAAGVRCLVLQDLRLDDTDWIRALAAQSGARVVVTGSRRLDLPTLRLGPLSLDQAVQRLRQRGLSGDLQELARRCGQLPGVLDAAVRPARLLGVDVLIERMELVFHKTRPRMEWARSALDADQQDALDRLAVFGGPFTAQAAERAAGVDVLMLEALLDHGVVYEFGGRIQGVPGEPDAVPAALADRHLGWIVDHMETHAAQVRRIGADALDAMQSELGEALHALPRAQSARPQMAARLLWALDPLLELRGLHATRRRLADAAATLDDWRAVLFRAREARWAGDLDRAEALYLQLDGGHRFMGLAAVAILRNQDPSPWLDQADFPDDPEWQARLHGMRAHQAERPVEALRDALAMHQARGDVRGQALILGQLAHELADQDRIDEAIQAIQQARAHSAALGDRTGRGIQGGMLGKMLHRRGDLDEADAIFCESLDQLQGRPRSHLIALLSRAVLYIEHPDRDPRPDLHRVRQEPDLAPWGALALAVLARREGDAEADAWWTEQSQGVRPEPETLEGRLLQRLLP